MIKTLVFLIFYVKLSSKNNYEFHGDLIMSKYETIYTENSFRYKTYVEQVIKLSPVIVTSYR